MSARRPVVYPEITESLRERTREALADTELRGNLFERNYLLRIRLLMNAVNHRHAKLHDMRVNRLIRGEHEFFNQPIGDVAGRRETLDISPLASNSICASGRSKSIDPRRSRLRCRINASSRINWKLGSRCAYSRTASGCPSNAAWTAV